MLCIAGTYHQVTSHMSPVNYHLSSSLASVAPSQALASRLAQTQSAAAGGHLQNGPGHAHHAGYNGYAGAGQFYYNQFQTPPVTNYQQHVVTNPAFTVYNQPGSEARSKSSDRVRTEKLKDSSSETNFWFFSSVKTVSIVFICKFCLRVFSFSAFSFSDSNSHLF